MEATAEIEMKAPSTEQQIFWRLVPPMDGIHVVIDVNDPQIEASGHERDVGKERKGGRGSVLRHDGRAACIDRWMNEMKARPEQTTPQSTKIANQTTCLSFGLDWPVLVLCFGMYT